MSIESGDRTTLPGSWVSLLDVRNRLLLRALEGACQMFEESEREQRARMKQRIVEGPWFVFFRSDADDIGRWLPRGPALLHRWSIQHLSYLRDGRGGRVVATSADAHDIEQGTVIPGHRDRWPVR